MTRQTSFPPGVATLSASTEQIEAYEEMQLDRHQADPDRAVSRLQSQPYAGRSRGRNTPDTDGQRPTTSAQQHPPPRPPMPAPRVSVESPIRPATLGGASMSDPRSHPHHRPSSQAQSTPSSGMAAAPLRQPVRYSNEERVYVPTISNADTSESRPKYDKLADVYSMSGDTVQFARNFGDYINEKIPTALWIGLMGILLVVGLAMLLFGAFNMPFCTIQPMIPIYLMVAGLLILMACGIRIFALIPSPQGRSRVARKRLSGTLCMHAIELLIGIANIVWLILGCVWVYGSRRRVHFREGIFLEHYCDESLYYLAFAFCTAQLIFSAIAIVVVLCLLCFGAYKEVESQDSLQ